MMTKNFSVALLSAFVLGLTLLFTLGIAFGSPGYLTSFNTTYGAAYNCGLCHTTSTGSPSSPRNPFGVAWANSTIGNHAIPINTALGNLDTDGDGVTNANELIAKTYPYAPMVSISSPTGGTASGTVTVTATASSNTGGSIAGVQFKLDGANLGAEDTASPYSVSWNTTTATNGSHTLTAVARDAAGNTATSAGVIVTVSNSTPDTTPPTVTTFTIPRTSNSLIVPITTFTATDNVGVTGYMVTESSTAPSASAAGWGTTPPTNFTLTTSGRKTLYAWARDAVGNVSSPKRAFTYISSRNGTSSRDTTPPTITAFTIPRTSNSLNVPITTFTATDNVEVKGYMVRESATAPRAFTMGWSSTPPTSYRFYRFTTAGTKTLYAWVKDAGGNVSPSRNATVTIIDEEESEQNKRDLPITSSQQDMTIWMGKWFEITETKKGYSTTNSTLTEHESSYVGYLNFRSWDPVNNVFQTDLYMYDEGRKEWFSEPLDLYYISGNPLDFLCSYQLTDNANNTSAGFNIHIQQTINNKDGSLRATLKTFGGYYVEENFTGELTIIGDEIPSSSVPVPSSIIIH